MSLRGPFAAVATLSAVLLLTGCAGENSADTTNTTSPSPMPSSSAPTRTNPGASGMPEQTAKALCDTLRSELSNWRVQTPTLGKTGLNIAVHQWAAQNGTVNLQVLRDRTIVDKITEQSCPDVRQQAIEALQIPDLASGLVGF